MIGTGTELVERYILREKIGVGGMAIVYRAVDKKTGASVAIKILKEELAADENVLARFKNEVSAAQGLHHPNVIRVYEYRFDEVEQIHFIVMEYVSGETIKAILAARKKLSSRDVCKISVRICRALRCAHKAGVIHRDIKPQNVMLDENGVVKVMDFGIAGAVNTSTITTQREALGSVHYMAPEQAKGIPSDERSDLYALGISMYEMITGELPFTGETPVAVAIQHLNKRMPNPCDSDPLVWKGLGDIIRKLTMKDPKNRYQSAEEAQLDLEKLLKNERQRFRIASSNEELAEGDMPRQEMVRKSILSTLGIAGITAAALFLIAILYTGFNNKILSMQIPSVLGYSVEEAIANTKEAGYSIVEEGYQYSEEYPAGKIILQSPEAGSATDTAGSIGVIVSLGKKSITVAPTLEGLSWEEALTYLKDTGINYTIGYRNTDEETKAGTVISQSPAGGSPFPEMDGVVDLSMKFVVSLGERRVAAQVPDVVGNSLAYASSRLKEEGFVVGTITYSPHENIEDGLVIAQSLAAGVNTEKGLSVDLTLSSGANTQGETIRDAGSIQIANPVETGIAQKLIVYEIDASGNRTIIYSQNINVDSFTVLSLNYDAGTVRIEATLGGMNQFSLPVNQ